MTNGQNYKALFEATQRLLSATTLNGAYKIVVEEALKLVKAKYGSIFLYQNRSFKRVYGSHPILFNVIPRREGNTYKVYRNRSYYLKPGKEVTSHHPEFGRLEVESDLTLALVDSGKTIAILSVLSEKGHVLKKHDVQTLKLFGPYATQRIKRIEKVERLEKTLMSRNLLISMAAHELRTPLTSIIAFSQLLARKLKEEKHKHVPLINKILDEEFRLKNMFSEFLEIRKAESDILKYHMSIVNLKKILEQAIFEVKSAYPHHSFKLLTSSVNNYKLRGDKNKLQQAFANILVNSAKFSSVDNPIVVTIRNIDNSVVVSVSDKGSGIPREKVKLVFEKFYKTSENSEGMGLGLYLVKRILDKHKAQILIDSELYKGTTVTVKLPLVEK